MRHEHLDTDPRYSVADLTEAVNVDADLPIFIADLYSNRDAVLYHVGQFVQRPGNSPRFSALGIYADAALKVGVFGEDPFAPRFPGDEEHQEDRRAIASMATSHLVRSWLTEHPESEPAQSVLRLGLDAPAEQHQALLHELWPALMAALVTPR